MEKNEENNSTGVENPARAMISKLRENQNSLHISRVPPKTKESFIAFADEEFLGDWGMTLKWLMDGIPNQDMRLVLTELDLLKERISELENSEIKKGEATSPDECPGILKTFGKRRNERYGTN